MIIKKCDFFWPEENQEKFASGQEKAVNVKVCENSAATLFSGKKFSENVVKIILKKSKTKSRVILNFWGVNFFRSFCCWIYKLYMNNKQTKPQDKKVVYGAKQSK